MKYSSEVTGITYENEDVVFFRNLYQSAFYIDHGARIVDVFTDSKRKLVFCFYKDDHKRIIDLWMQNKESKEGSSLDNGNCK